MSMRCTYLPSGPSSGVLQVDGADAAIIEDLSLRDIRFSADAPPLLGTRLPVPLYWRQYHRHEEPGRSVSSAATVTQISQSAGSVSVRCEGRTPDGTVLSRVDLMLRADDRTGQFEYHVTAALEVDDGAEWSVSWHADHGDIEFLNLWPEAVFTPERPEDKRYSACCVLRPDGIRHIPHHHLESRDKKNIPLHGGDVFAWLLEDHNPAVEIIAPAVVEAGICAYMWDAHFGVRVCTDGRDAVLTGGRRVTAAYRLFTLSRHEGEFMLFTADSDDDPSLLDVPLVEEGRSLFDTHIATVLDPGTVWPWNFSGAPGASGGLDTPDGRAGARSLVIRGAEGLSRWEATTLGPAFGGAPFIAGGRYRLRVSVKTSLERGFARIALRWHREGRAGISDPNTYERLSSAGVGPRCDWTDIIIETDAIDPAPDRLHILLESAGEGECWFDAVEFQRIEAQGGEGSGV
ncbi:MAG: hypothetical protein HY962_12780 [Ignavibacteriae bacterium]|nr:hypothetical protein [Ignavibacteriota bacterium]